MLEQIAANKVYIDYLEKGYKIAHFGLQTIQDIKKGDFNLHFNFFDSLRSVNPKIKKWAKVADIIAYQLSIIKNTKQTIAAIKDAGQFTNDELDYCKKVFDNLLNECLKSIDELVMIITDGQATMKDDERMKRIDKLYLEMQDKYSFAASFSNEMGLLSEQRLNERAEILMDKKINDYQ
ncbi:MAG: hypothetical protein ABI688_00680 [Bacteroidota bacterium]